MISFLRQHVNNDASLGKEVFWKDQYFNDLTLANLNEECVFFDCGAYNGDTITNFLQYGDFRYKKIFAIEPDSSNFDKLKKFIERNEYKNVQIFNCGVWNKKGAISFDSAADTATSSFLEAESDDTAISVDTIDNILNGEPVTFIKMDVEGSELNALKGAQNSIKTFKPVLAICVYHKAEDLITIPQFIKSLHSGYKLYVRKHTIYSTSELVMYALP